MCKCNAMLVGNKVTLRPLELEDAPRCARWVNNREIALNTLAGRLPMSVLQEREWIERTLRSQHDVVLAICSRPEGLHVGNCGLHDIEPFDRFAELGIMIGPPDQRSKGYGSEALRLMLDYGFRTLNLHRIDMRVFDFNVRALRLYRNLGFTEEGRLRQRRFKDGVYKDEILLSMLAHEWEAGMLHNRVIASEQAPPSPEDCA